jgi:mannose-6-phosphate isomerase-like protein (cupin superfamily)
MKPIDKVNLAAGFARISEHWSPKIAGELNDFQVKLVKLQGEFVWHHHELEDELFLVIKGRLTMKLRGSDVILEPGQFLVVPHGVEHCPAAAEECWILLLEPATTLNTGNVENERTRRELDRIG